MQQLPERMALERFFTRVLNKLPEGDAIALAVLKDKVIQLLHEGLLAEGLLVGREGGGSPTASTRSGDVVASLQKGVSASSGAESLKGIPFLYRDSINAYSYPIIHVGSYLCCVHGWLATHRLTPSDNPFFWWL